MNYSMKSPTTRHDGVREPLVGGDVPHVMRTGNDDLSDWVDLMEAVEALCPVWPSVPQRGRGEYRL